MLTKIIEEFEQIEENNGRMEMNSHKTMILIINILPLAYKIISIFGNTSKCNRKTKNKNY